MTRSAPQDYEHKQRSTGREATVARRADHVGDQQRNAAVLGAGWR
eukprot:COSAG06_NODE_147_length_22091_cov_70.669880_18_plen_45_part_00